MEATFDFLVFSPNDTMTAQNKTRIYLFVFILFMILSTSPEFGTTRKYMLKAYSDERSFSGNNLTNEPELPQEFQVRQL